MGDEEAHRIRRVMAHGQRKNNKIADGERNFIFDDVVMLVKRSFT